MATMHFPRDQWGTLRTAGKRADIFTGRKVVEMGLLAPIVTCAGLQKALGVTPCGAIMHVSTTSGPRAAGREHLVNVAISAFGHGRLTQRHNQMDLTRRAPANIFRRWLRMVRHGHVSHVCLSHIIQFQVQYSSILVSSTVVRKPRTSASVCRSCSIAF